jgi:hypothetical protein
MARLWPVAGRVIAMAYTGSEADPFSQTLADARFSKYGVLLCCVLDRLSRGGLEWDRLAS